MKNYFINRTFLNKMVSNIERKKPIMAPTNGIKFVEEPSGCIVVFRNDLSKSFEGFSTEIPFIESCFL